MTAGCGAGPELRPTIAGKTRNQQSNLSGLVRPCSFDTSVDVTEAGKQDGFRCLGGATNAR